MRIKVWRSGPAGKDGRYEVYEVDTRPGMNLLEALFEVQDKHDDSLAFRYSCRGAVCGSCAMMINREIRLACRTQLSAIWTQKPQNLAQFEPLQREVAWDRGAEILVEPLPGLPVLKDLVVDMTRFYEYYRRVKPWLDPPEASEENMRLTPAEAARQTKWANCILCAACHGSCPVCWNNTRYLGPAALAWSLRFVDDPRCMDKLHRLAAVKDEDGVPACEWFYNCVRVCPKEVAPAAAIRRLKQALIAHGMLAPDERPASRTEGL